MKISLKKYLLYSSVFAIFTEAFFFNYIIDWKLLYLIIFVNYLILFRIKKITFNYYFLGLLVFFFIHGALAYTIISIPYNFMLSQILGIAVVGTYYYNFIPLYDKEEIIRVYLKICLFAAVVGYPMFFLNINVNDGRLQSFFKEPAHYVIVVIPACYYYLKTRKYLSFAIIFGTLILSNSSLGYIGCGLMFLVPNLTLRRVRYLVASLPVVLMVFIYVYNEYPFFKLRVDDTYRSLKVINTGKFQEHTNLSSYVLISNLFIAKKNVTDHPLGSGIGSHHYMHTQRYLKEMRPPPYLRIIDRYRDNSFDANSLFTRVCSEFGLFGFVFILVMMYYASRAFTSDELYFAQAIFIYLLMKLLRDGHYFPPELYFFIWMAFYSIKEHIQKQKARLV